MASSNRSSRLPAYTLPNGNGETTSHTSAFGGLNSIWDQPGNYPSRRGSAAPRGSRGSDQTLQNGLSGSSALGASEADSAWARPNGVWPDSSQTTRNASGSTSPTRTRDSQAPPHDASSFLTHNSHPSIGQHVQSFGSSRSNAISSQIAATDTFTYSNLGAKMAETAQDVSSLGPKSFLHNFIRDPQMLPQVSKDDESHQQYNDDGTLYVSSRQAPHMRNPSRPTLSGPSSSLPLLQVNSTSGAYNLAYAHEEFLRTDFARLALTDSMPNGTRPNATPQSQLNPFSPAWDNALSSRPNGMDTRANPGVSSYALPGPRGPGGRDSSANSGHRPSLNSPQSFGITQPADPWPRAESGAAMAPESGRRPSAPVFQPQQQQQPPYSYLNHYNTPQHQSPVFNQYGDHYTPPASIRSQMQMQMPMQMNGFGVNFSPYLSTGIPHRPSRDRDPGQGMRSELLEEYRHNSRSNKKWDLKGIYDHVVEFSGDQHGSRFIQNKLETANSDDKDRVFQELLPDAVPLMKDVFGNYVIQKFFEHGSQLHKKQLAARMKGQVAELSTQMYACRVVQEALKHVLHEQQMELVEELEPDVIRITKDQNGNHVIQLAIKTIRPHVSFIMDAFRGHVSELAHHAYACRVIQRILEHGAEQDKTAVMKELHECAPMLITDQYGNYVIQRVIENGAPEDRQRMIDIVVPQFLSYSKHKYASNVVEKCIVHGSKDDVAAMRKQLYGTGSDKNSPMLMLTTDQYGNYVIQQLLGKFKGEDQERFAAELEHHLRPLKQSSSGRQTAAIDRLMTAISEVRSKNSLRNGVAALDINSTAPTPDLTQANSPRTSTSPSTHDSTVDESAEDTHNVKAMAAENPTPRSAEEV